MSSIDKGPNVVVFIIQGLFENLMSNNLLRNRGIGKGGYLELMERTEAFPKLQFWGKQPLKIAVL
jgi:hypothetical protein